MLPLKIGLTISVTALVLSVLMIIFNMLTHQYGWTLAMLLCAVMNILSIDSYLKMLKKDK